jgi:DNA-binding transcriptional LysR family regulator
VSPPRLAGVDLNLLVALDALLQERSVTRAGERLALTQSSMSGVLARLRAQFGDELLVRRGRTMLLTPLAETLREPVREILLRIEESILGRAEFHAPTAVRTFRVVASDYAALVFIRNLVALLERLAPNISLQLEAAGIERAHESLQRGEIDLAIVPSRFSQSSGLPWRPLFEDRFVAVVWRENREVHDPLTWEQFRQLPYLTYRLGPQPVLVDSLLEELGHGRQPHATVEGFAIGALLIAGTRQVTFLQERLAMAFREAGELRLLEPPLAIPRLVETMLWHPRSDQDPGHAWLRDQIVGLAATI